ncbi:MAG: hypothetical protein QOJ54_3629 [Aliidongia sp.]|jgi:hypothetical protein|nr:hypothetical protein [Aliidongia sp.]
MDIKSLTVPSLSDPLATILPTDIYLILQDKLNPHVPLVDALKQVVALASPEQHALMATRAKMVSGLSGAVIAALNAGQR